MCNFCGLLSIYLRTIKDDTNICLLIDDNNTQRQQVKYSVYYLCGIVERQLVFQKKKKKAHAYFKRRIFLSLLAGKFTKIEQMSRTE